MGIDLTTTIGFGAIDLFRSAASLVANFWQFILMGLAIVVGPWIGQLITRAVKDAAARRTGGDVHIDLNDSKSANRVLRRYGIKGEFRGGKFYE
jgi:hypothetical protein